MAVLFYFEGSPNVGVPVKLDSYGKADIFSESFEYKPVDRDKVVKIGDISLSKDEEALTLPCLQI